QTPAVRRTPVRSVDALTVTSPRAPHSLLPWHSMAARCSCCTEPGSAVPSRDGSLRTLTDAIRGPTLSRPAPPSQRHALPRRPDPPLSSASTPLSTALPRHRDAYPTTEMLSPRLP